MDLESILNELRDQCTRLDQAIAALQGTSPSGYPAKRGRKRGRHLTAAARARIAAAKKAWWAKQKRKSIGTKSKPTKRVKRTPMSPAARKRLSAMMKARWAERKKAA